MLRIIVVVLTLLYSMALLSHGLLRAEDNTRATNIGKPPKPKLDVGFITTPQHVVDLMVSLADIKKGDLVYDLGCGDGRIAVTAAKKFGCRAIGVDIDPQRVEQAKANAKSADVEDLVTIQQEDIFELDLSEADVVLMYLIPKLNVRLIPQLETLKPGARIVSHDSDMPGVEPDVVVTIDSKLDGENKLYLWQTPLRKVATARGPTPTPVVAAGGTEWTISFEQILQLVSFAILLIVVIIWFTQRRRKRA